MTVHSVDPWTITLMLGVTAIWLSMAGAVAYLAQQTAARR